MGSVAAESKISENQKSCLDVVRDAFLAKPVSVRIVVVLTFEQEKPNFDIVEEGLQSRATGNEKNGVTGVASLLAHFAVIFLEGTAAAVMDCIRWMDQLEKAKQICEGIVVFFSDYRFYKLMPCYWSFRPKDISEMRFEGGEELSEEAVEEHVTLIYEKMIRLAHEVRAANLESGMELTGLVAKELARFAPDPKSIHALLSAPITKSLLFSLEEFKENFIGDFNATLPHDFAF